MEAADTWQTPYEAYKTSPSPDTLRAVVHTLKPTVEYSLAAVNANTDPVVRGKALLYTAEAVQKYDPKFGASLPSWIGSQLRQLTRTARQQRAPVRLPERVQLDAYHLYNSEKELSDKLGRTPNVAELADFTKLPVKRIAKIRGYQKSVVPEGVVGDLSADIPDHAEEALQYVYGDADHLDRRIIELKTGYGGTKLMAPADIARELRLTPTELSRRSARLTYRINGVQDTLSKVVT